MDLKRALETQRVNLLRLVTGWIAMLGILTVGPLMLPLPRWIRAFFETMLVRVEYAAQYLVQISARMQAGGGLVVPALPPCPVREGEGDVPSARDLLRRMKALRDVLENLPRYARRLLKVQKIAGEVFDWSVPFYPTEARGFAMGIGANPERRPSVGV